MLNSPIQPNRHSDANQESYEDANRQSEARSPAPAENTERDSAHHYDCVSKEHRERKRAVYLSQGNSI
jgi:hypothetical protein